MLDVEQPVDEQERTIYQVSCMSGEVVSVSCYRFVVVVVVVVVVVAVFHYAC